MKKAALFFMAILSILALGLLNSKNIAAIERLRPDAEYVFYTDADAPLPALPAGASVLKNGNALLIVTGIQNAGALRARIQNLAGESLSYSFMPDDRDGINAGADGADGFSGTADSSFSAEAQDELDFLLDFYGVRVSSVQTLSGLKVATGYSVYGRKPVTVDGASVNIQIAVNGTRATIGTPLILGSY